VLRREEKERESREIFCPPFYIHFRENKKQKQESEREREKEDPFYIIKYKK
jgi:hypothetical protein